jgi:hypothetical protein
VIKKNGYSGALIASMMASETSFVIEHPGKSREVSAIYFAGVDGALDSYQAISKKRCAVPPRTSGEIAAEARTRKAERLYARNGKNLQKEKLVEWVQRKAIQRFGSKRPSRSVRRVPENAAFLRAVIL